MRALAASLVAILFFALVGGVFALAASISMLLVYALIAVAALGAVYVGTGGRAWFGTHERPERILGARLRFGAVEEHPTLTSLPDAIVREWDDGQYRVEFVEPLPTAGRERHAMLFARHAGYPVSRVRTWRSVIVNGRFGTSDGFIASVRQV